MRRGRESLRTGVRKEEEERERDQLSERLRPQRQNRGNCVGILTLLYG